MKKDDTEFSSSEPYGMVVEAKGLQQTTRKPTGVAPGGGGGGGTLVQATKKK